MADAPDPQPPCPQTPEVPDPNGPPVLSYCSLKAGREFLNKTVPAGIVLGIGGVAAFLVLGTFAQPTMGALRSHHVRWEERQRAIADAQAADAAATVTRPDQDEQQNHD
jgi:hypothetical protein